MNFQSWFAWIKRSCPVCNVVWEVAALSAVPGSPFISMCPDCKSYLGKEFSILWKVLILALVVGLLGLILLGTRLGGWVGFFTAFMVAVSVEFIAVPMLYFRFAKIFPLQTAQPRGAADAASGRPHG